MLKFVRGRKGVITQGFNQNLNDSYAKAGNTGHSGIDWWVGHLNPVYADNDGYVYKVFKPWQLKSNWSATYTICETNTPNLVMEICYGHLNSHAKKVGETVSAGEYIGEQGNFGNVYSGGKRITVKMQKEGDTRGSHVHESWRPCLLVDKITKGMHYLRDEDGNPSKYKGKFMEIINRDNGVKGHIDPTANRTLVYLKTTLMVAQNALAKLKK